VTPSRGVRRLLLAAAVCAVLTTVAGPVALAACLAALTGAAVLAMRAGWAAHGDPPPAPDLDRLRAEHLAAVDAALDEGRHDVARALVDEHQEQIRRLRTGDRTRRA
jgi:hypothetical protein